LAAAVPFPVVVAVAVAVAVAICVRLSIGLSIGLPFVARLPPLPPLEEERRVGGPQHVSVTAAIDAIRVDHGLVRPILDIKLVHAAVKQIEAKYDGHDGGDGARSNNDAPDHVDKLLTLVVVEGIEAALLGVDAVGRVPPKQHPHAHHLGQCLADGLHGEDGSHHLGAGLGARPLGRDDGAERILGPDAWGAGGK
jgi:hypothetical protein